MLIYQNVGSPGIDNGAYNTTGTYKDVTMVPVASSAWTTSDGLVLGGSTALNLTGVDLTDAVTFGVGNNLVDRFITKAAAVTQGYTIGILLNQSIDGTFQKSVKSFAGSGMSISDIPNDAILYAYSNQVNSSGQVTSVNASVDFVLSLIHI